MKNQITNYIKQCDICSPLRRHYKHNTPGVVVETPSAPFEILNCDIFYNNLSPNLIIIDDSFGFSQMLNLHKFTLSLKDSS